ncbi:MAG: hypothetical protein ACOYYS_12675 [Chloroflexota bacterium]
MEVDSPQPPAVQWMVAGYTSDAAWASAALSRGETDRVSLESVRGLLGSFVRWRPFLAASQPAAEAVVDLARAAFHHLDHDGCWREILAWWPVLEAVAGDYQRLCAQAELRVQRATIQNYCSQLEDVERAYQDYVETDEFGALPCALQARVLLQAGICSLRQGKNARAAVLLNRSLALGGRDDAYLQVCALNQLGNLALSAGDHSAAESRYLRCLERAEAIGCVTIASVARCSLGRLYVAFQNRAQEAIRLLEQNLVLPRDVTGVDGAAESAVCLAMAYAACGRSSEAWVLACRTLAVFQDLEHHYGMVFCRIVLGRVQQVQVRSEEAILHWRIALDMLDQVHLPLLELYVLNLMIGEFLRARRWQAALALLPRLGSALFRQKSGLRLVGRLLMRS